MNLKRGLWLALSLVAVAATLLASCATPTPVVQVQEKPVVQTVVVTQPPVIQTAAPIIQTVEVTKWSYITPTVEATPSKPIRGGTVHITYFQGWGGLDPHKSTGGSTINLLAAQIYDGLFKYDAKRNIVANLAESYEVSDDGLTFTFHLRKGVKFHNGKELKAEDVVYSIERAAHDADSLLQSFFTPLDKVVAVDDYTVQIVNKYQWAPFLDKLAHPNMGILPKGHTPSESEGYIGTGPFMVESNINDVEVVLVRNPDYWNAGPEGLPYLDKVVFSQIGDEMARFGSLMSGQSDLIFTPPHSARARLNSDPQFTIYLGFAQFEGIAVSTFRVPAFANPLVREAINIAFNRKKIVEVALDGVGMPILGDFQEPGSWSYNPTEFYPAEGDMAKAKELLAEAGYADGFSFTLSNWEMWPTEVKAGQLIQEWFKELNIEVTLEHVDPSVWVEKCYEGNIDAVFQGYGAPLEPDLDFRGAVHPQEAYIHNIWDSQTISTMIEDAAKEMDRDRRAKDYQALVDALYAHGEDTYTPLFLLWREPQDIAMNTARVHGYESDGGLGWLLSLPKWWVADGK
jgi:peptide/nickel transport system substrate-binding protein